jgi:hypothetical protein
MHTPMPQWIRIPSLLIAASACLDSPFSDPPSLRSSTLSLCPAISFLPCPLLLSLSLMLILSPTMPHPGPGSPRRFRGPGAAAGGPLGLPPGPLARRPAGPRARGGGGVGSVQRGGGAVLGAAAGGHAGGPEPVGASVLVSAVRLLMHCIHPVYLRLGGRRSTGKQIVARFRPLASRVYAYACHY